MNQVPMSDQTVCYLRCLVEAQIQALYDDPNGFAVDFGEAGNQGHSLAERIKIGVKQELHELREACNALRLEFDEVVKQEATPTEINRLQQIIGGN